MNKNIFILAILLIVTSCATSQQIIGPDGTLHELITCENGVASCYEKATEMCGGKYDIINSSSQMHGSKKYVATEISLLVKCSK